MRVVLLLLMVLMVVVEVAKATETAHAVVMRVR